MKDAERHENGRSLIIVILRIRERIRYAVAATQTRRSDIINAYDAKQSDAAGRRAGAHNQITRPFPGR